MWRHTARDYGLYAFMIFREKTCGCKRSRIRRRIAMTSFESWLWLKCNQDLTRDNIQMQNFNLIFKFQKTDFRFPRSRCSCSCSWLGAGWLWCHMTHNNGSNLAVIIPGKNMRTQNLIWFLGFKRLIFRFLRSQGSCSCSCSCTGPRPGRCSAQEQEQEQ